MRETTRDFIKDEAGMGTVEIILIKQLNDLVKKVFQKISSDSNSIISAAECGRC